MKLLMCSLLTFFISNFAIAEIKVVKVSNGKAIIQFDPADNVTTDTKLVLEDLAMSLPSSGTQSVELNCPACPKLPEPLPAPEYQRNHLISGSLESSSQDVTARSGASSAKTEVKTTELDASYYYNFKNFALGFTLYNEKVSYDEFEDLSTTVAIGGKYFFLENVAKNKIIPYVGIELVSVHTDFYDTPRIETKLSGTMINLGALVFLADAAFIALDYSFGSVDGDTSQGSTTVQIESEGGGLSVGVGIALQ